MSTSISNQYSVSEHAAHQTKSADPPARYQIPSEELSETIKNEAWTGQHPAQPDKIFYSPHHGPHPSISDKGPAEGSKAWSVIHNKAIVIVTWLLLTSLMVCIKIARYAAVTTLTNMVACLLGRHEGQEAATTSVVYSECEAAKVDQFSDNTPKLPVSSSLTKVNALSSGSYDAANSSPSGPQTENTRGVSMT
jgi:hypothetical protein